MTQPMTQPMTQRNFQLPGRSPVMAQNGMVATSHPLATSSALKVLQNGGNAVDAAIAASAVLCVVEPQMTGIGGDCFAILHQPDGSIHGLNGSGRSAKRANLDWFLERGITDFSRHLAHTVTVPGALKAWDVMLQRFGTRDMKSLFADAINYGRNGFVVAPRVAKDWGGLVDHIKSNEAASEQLLIDGQAPIAGQKFALPKLANTLERIANEGIDAFYNGSIAAEMANAVQEQGGLLCEQDLAGVSAEWITPISAHYRGFDIQEIPPAGQGITALILLQILQKLNAHTLDVESVERVHMEIEAARLAYCVRDAYVADPVHMRTTIVQMLGANHISQLAQMFSPKSRNQSICLPQLPDSDTVYLCVVDKNMQAVSFINSLYGGFGSGIATPNSGIVLQNRGACFSLTEGHDNALGGGKLPLHTIIPGMITKNDQLVGPFGVMGGAYQPMGHAHVLTNMIDYGMDPQQALDHGRVFWGQDDVLEVEASLAPMIHEGLMERGHKTRGASSPWGGGQMIWIDQQRGVMIGASDPRKDGMAAGY